MAETEHDELDLDVEIVDLDRPAPHPRFGLKTLRQRRLSLWLTGLLFVVVIGVLLGSTPDVRNLLAKNWFQPALTGIVVPDHFFFYLQANPSWGQFTLDGHALTHLPRIAQDQPLSFAPGTHKIVWQAAPFNARTCLFTVVNAVTFSGTCVNRQEVKSQITNRPPHLALPLSLPVMLFTFFASFNDLPAGQRASLISQTRTQLAGFNSSAEVYPGEVYAVSDQATMVDPTLCHPYKSLNICFTRANQPLIASVSVQVDISTASGDPCVTGQCLTNDQICQLPCNLSSSGEAVSPGWEISATIHLSWSYQTLSGQVIASDQPDSSLRDETTGYAPVFSLHITRDRQDWHVALSPNQSVNNVNDLPYMQANLDTTELYGLDTADNFNSIGIEDAYLQTQEATGYLVVIKPLLSQGSTPATPKSATPSVPQAPAYYLSRFGVILAVNDVARTISPELPVADAYEQTLAQQMLAQIHLDRG